MYEAELTMRLYMMCNVIVDGFNLNYNAKKMYFFWKSDDPIALRIKDDIMRTNQTNHLAFCDISPSTEIIPNTGSIGYDFWQYHTAIRSKLEISNTEISY